MLSAEDQHPGITWKGEETPPSPHCPDFLKAAWVGKVGASNATHLWCSCTAQLCRLEMLVSPEAKAQQRSLLQGVAGGPPAPEPEWRGHTACPVWTHDSFCGPVGTG